MWVINIHAAEAHLPPPPPSPPTGRSHRCRPSPMRATTRGSAGQLSHHIWQRCAVQLVATVQVCATVVARPRLASLAAEGVPHRGAIVESAATFRARPRHLYPTVEAEIPQRLTPVATGQATLYSRRRRRHRRGFRLSCSDHSTAASPEHQQRRRSVLLATVAWEAGEESPVVQ